MLYVRLRIGAVGAYHRSLHLLKEQVHQGPS
jgi:hypothetical protein